MTACRPEPLEERYPELFDKQLWGKGGTGAVRQPAAAASAGAAADASIRGASSGAPGRKASAARCSPNAASSRAEGKKQK